MKINKLLLGLLALSLSLFVADRSAVGVHAYNTYVATLFPGDVAVNGDIKVIGGDLLDSAETTRLTIGATNSFVGNLTATGNITTTGGYFKADELTEATLKASTPTVKGEVYYDSTNDEYVKSTGTTTSLDWSQIHDKTAAPVGW